MTKILLTFSIFFLFLPANIKADTQFPTTEGNIHLIESESPYILNSSITVASGTSLTIDAGVCVKILPIGSILTQGDLYAVGTSEKPIIFTSIKNDSVCGDSNEDGEGSVPALGDWLGIQTHGSVVLEHVDISYAVNGISVNAGGFNISNSNINNNLEGGIVVYGAEIVSVSNNIFENNKFPIDISTNIPFSHASNSASGNQKNGISISGHSVGNVSLTKDNISYYTSGISIASGTTLIIDAGVCVKILPIGSILTHGNLVLNGTKEESVYITSIKDDSVCGDTNGDGSASAPSAGDWPSITVESGGVLDARFTDVRYGGGQGGSGIYPNIKNNRGDILLNNSSSTNAFLQGFYSASGSSTIISTGFKNQPVGVEIGGGNVTISKSSFEGLFGGAVLNNSGATTTAQRNWWGSDTGPNHYLLNPEGDGDYISGAIDFSDWLGANPKTWVIDPVIIIPGILGSWKDWHGDWKLDPITHTYDNLVGSFKANGYIDGQSLFPFPYDWEKSNVDTAILLKQKIADVRAVCGCAKVDIVAHSMGGLIARQYIQSVDYQNDVDQIIFLGTPHLGSVFAYFAYEGGELDNDPSKKILFSYIARKKGYGNMANYAHNGVLSMKELLPIQSYLKLESGVQLNYPQGYPPNLFLENLDSNLSIFPQKVRKIRNFVGDVGISSTPVLLTISSSTKNNLWPDGEPIETEYGNGDNRVSTTSAIRVGGTISTHNIQHGNLTNELKQEILEELTLNDGQQLVDKDYNKNILLFLVNSPIDITVTSPSGQIYGANGIENDSGNVFYTNVGDEEFLAINDPEQGEYQVASVGTGEGNYSVEMHLLGDGIEAETSTFGVASVGVTNTGTINVTSSSIGAVVSNNAVINDISPVAIIQKVKSSITLNPVVIATNTPVIIKKSVVVNEQKSVTQQQKFYITNPHEQKRFPVSQVASVGIFETKISPLFTNVWGGVKSLIKLIIGK